jgi:hypothetical protein
MREGPWGSHHEEARLLKCATSSGETVVKCGSVVPEDDEDDDEDEDEAEKREVAADKYRGVPAREPTTPRNPRKTGNA